MDKLAIIGAGKMACIFAINAKEMGIETHCFAWDNGAIAKEYVDYFYPISIFEKDEILNKCKELKISGIVATTELTISVVAYIANKLNLNGNDYNVSKIITDKYRNREVCKNIDELNQPKYIMVKSIEEVLKANLEYPMIIKPTNKGGKRGISVINSYNDLKTAFDYAYDDVGEDNQFIVEEFVEGGTEYSIESLTYHGVSHIIQITEKISSGPPHCVELGHKQPANLSREMKEKIKRIMKKALEAIGVNNGPCHTEIKIKKGKIYLIEFNARPGGDHIAYPLTHLSSGYEYIKGIIKIAFDKNPNINENDLKKYYAGVIFITEQTKRYKKLFDVCEKYEWCYKKNLVSNELLSLRHNDGYNTNYIMYFSKDKKLDFEKIIDNLEEQN